MRNAINAQLDHADLPARDRQVGRRRRRCGLVDVSAGRTGSRDRGADHSGSGRRHRMVASGLERRWRHASASSWSDSPARRERAQQVKEKP